MKKDETEKFLVPLGYRLLVKLDRVEETVIKELVKDDGEKMTLYAPDKHCEETRLGTLLAIGHKCEKHWKVGDRIVMSFQSGTVIDLLRESATDDTIRMVSEENVMGALMTKEEEEKFNQIRLNRQDEGYYHPPVSEE